MAEIEYTLKRKGVLRALPVSLAIHLLLLFLLLRQGNRFILESGGTPMQPAAKQPIAFEIVETPEAARVKEPQEDALLLSDKNALAMDENNSNLPVLNTPFSQGISDVKELPSTPVGAVSSPVPPGNAANGAAEEAEEKTRNQDGAGSVLSQRSSARNFRSDLLLGGSADRRNASYRQQDSRAANTGGMSFNTYEWEFAPYMLELKKKIQKNIFPPAAFTRLGFGGKNLISFRIYPDGRLEGPEVLQVEGEEALAETSCKAVVYSAPFRALPDNFPEEYLEVTARFEYFIARD